MKIMVTSFKKSHALTAALSAPQPSSRPPLSHASTRDSWTFVGKSGEVSCGITASFSWVLVHTRFCLCPSRVCIPVLHKFWRLDGGINGSPLLTHVSTGDTQTQFWVSLLGSLVSGAHKVCLSPPSISGRYGA